MRLKHVKGAEEIIKSGTHYIEFPKQLKGTWSKTFKNNNPIHIEIGMGKGDFIVENALKYPNINFIGIEKFDSVIVRAIQKTNELNITNLKLIRMDALEINEVFDKEVDIIYLNFSDPWPKERHAKRRLTSPIFLKKYDDIFRKNANIVMKTDNNPLFDYSLETLAQHGYEMISITRDLYSEDISDNIATEYEKKFVNRGIKINRFIATKDMDIKKLIQ